MMLNVALFLSFHESTLWSSESCVPFVKKNLGRVIFHIVYVSKEEGSRTGQNSGLKLVQNALPHHMCKLYLYPEKRKWGTETTWLVAVQHLSGVCMVWLVDMLGLSRAGGLWLVETQLLQEYTPMLVCNLFTY
jgi:hypothetical protein